MPMEYLSGGGEPVRAALLSMGLRVNIKARDDLAQYLNSKKPQRDEPLRCVPAVGWCGDVFVLPDAVIGDGADGVIFQSGDRPHAEYATKGNLEGWQQGIAGLAVGNPLLMLAISATFTGALLKRIGAPGGGGVHFYGESTTGKTTLLAAAAATWGGERYRRSWKSTANGIEAAATLFNDGVLILDEISECDPRDVGAIVYALGNGYGKQRANRYGQARTVESWQTVVLSSGEKQIATAMLEGGHKAKAGQLVRLLDIPTTRVYGAFDTLHGMASPKHLANTLLEAARTHYGHAGRAFLERLTRHPADDLRESFKAIMQDNDFSGGEGQEGRAGDRFALVALAGELAADWGIVPWEAGSATEAAAVAFSLWRQGRPQGNIEKHQIIQQLDDFISSHGDFRFSSMGSREANVNNRAGWWREEDTGSRVYCFNAAGLREALKGFELETALNVLEAAGRLDVTHKKEAEKRRSRTFKINGRVERLYVITPAMEAI
jgi:putative DNA primase/helicase